MVSFYVCSFGSNGQQVKIGLIGYGLTLNMWQAITWTFDIVE